MDRARRVATRHLILPLQLTATATRKSNMYIYMVSRSHAQGFFFYLGFLLPEPAGSEVSQAGPPELSRRRRREGGGGWTRARYRDLRRYSAVYMVDTPLMADEIAVLICRIELARDCGDFDEIGSIVTTHRNKISHRRIELASVREDFRSEDAGYQTKVY